MDEIFGLQVAFWRRLGMFDIHGLRHSCPCHVLAGIFDLQVACSRRPGRFDILGSLHSVSALPSPWQF